MIAKKQVILCISGFALVTGFAEAADKIRFTNAGGGS